MERLEELQEGACSRCLGQSSSRERRRGAMLDDGNGIFSTTDVFAADLKLQKRITSCGESLCCLVAPVAN